MVVAARTASVTAARPGGCGYDRRYFVQQAVLSGIDLRGGIMCALQSSRPVQFKFYYCVDRVNADCFPAVDKMHVFER